VRDCAGDVDQPADGIGRAFDAWLGSIENHPCTGWWCGGNPDIARVHNVRTDLFDEALAIEAAHDSDTDV
jgi:hypothetical protein